MSQRTERVAGEVRAIIGEVIARREIKDPRVQGAGLITITHVRLSGDLRQAWALFTVHNAGDAELEHVREGLERASGFLRHAIARRLRLKVTPTLNFEIDRVFEQASRVEHLLHEIASSAPPNPEGGEQSTDGAEQSADSDGAGDDDQQRE
ncbi:MAG TPA: 30S ribosome-binding factor RbfA [Polyangia bacterium]|nr:30S ribosome-binding factor RbfA [Polyangia bacterium]